MQTHRTIYKRTSSGKVQIWYAITDGGKYRTVSGQQDGKKTESEWTIVKPKNVGKVNATTAEEQALLEVQAIYRKKLEKDYRESLDNIDTKLFVAPMLAAKWKDRVSKIAIGTVIYYQHKFDGFRAVASKAGVFSRNGKIIPGAFYIQELLAPLFEKHPTLVLDGELYNHEYKEDFEELSSLLKGGPETEEERQLIIGRVQFWVYDVPSHTGLQEERDEYRKMLFETEPVLQLPQFVFVWSTKVIYSGPNCLDEHVNRSLDEEFEGGMARLNGRYVNKRSNDLMKIKNFIDGEFRVRDVEEGKGNWAGHAKRVYIEVPGAKISSGNLYYEPNEDQIKKYVFSNVPSDNAVRISKASVKGNKDYARELLEKKHNIIGKMATVTYFRLSADGVPYLPILKVIRWDI